MNYLVLDIETVPSEVAPSEKKPSLASALADFCFNLESLRQAEKSVAEFRSIHRDDFPPPPCHRVVCIGAARVREEGAIEELFFVPGDDEKTILKNFTKLIGDDGLSPPSTQCLVSWNGRGFDLPVLLARSMRYGLALPSVWDAWHGYRYEWNSPAVDLCDWWQGFGAGRKFSMNQASQLIGLPGKPEGVDGGSVADMIRDGRLEDVRRYCLSDVAQTAGILLRTLLLRGFLSKEDYTLHADRLLRTCVEEGISWVSERSDRHVFLLLGGA